MSISSRIPRRCINCGGSENQGIAVMPRRYEGMTVFVCQDPKECARRFHATQNDQPTLDWTAIEYKPGF